MPAEETCLADSAHLDAQQPVPPGAGWGAGADAAP
jgi:hypothetical protein